MHVQAKSYGVVMGDHGATHGDQALQGMAAATPAPPANDSYFALAEGSLSSYSTALRYLNKLQLSLYQLSTSLVAHNFFLIQRNHRHRNFPSHPEHPDLCRGVLPEGQEQDGKQVILPLSKHIKL